MSDWEHQGCGSEARPSSITFASPAPGRQWGLSVHWCQDGDGTGKEKAGREAGCLGNGPTDLPYPQLLPLFFRHVFQVTVLLVSLLCALCFVNIPDVNRLSGWCMLVDTILMLCMEGLLFLLCRKSVHIT